MRTTCTAEQIEDELNELKLRIAKMNARRNAQINLLQKNISDGSLRNKVYSKPSDILGRNYLHYPSYYRYPLLYPWKYSSTDNLLDTYYEPDDSLKKSVSFLSEKELPEAYKLLERKAQSDIISKLKRFVLDQENEMTNEFVDKLVYPRKAAYSPKLNYETDDLKTKTYTNLYSNDIKSPFLKPINKSDNFYKRYNSFMKRILKPFRRTTPLSRINEYKNPISTPSPNTSWKYKRPSPVPKYFPPKINRPLSPIKSPLNDLDASYLRPWYRYSPIYRNYLYDYEYIPKSYKVPKDVDAIIRDMEFENRRTYPFMSTYPYSRSNYNYDVTNSMKYDPYESDSYVRSNLPTWKQYYYTQKLRSKPSNERLVDYYDPYRDFFHDVASIKSDDLSLPPNREESEVNSIYDDGYSFPDSVKSYDNPDDLQIIDDYRDMIYDDIIKNLRSQQTRSYPKKVHAGRKTRTLTRLFTPGILKNDRSLYNYRITEPTSSYSWNKKPSNYTYNKLSSSDLTLPLESKYNFQKTDNLNNTSLPDDKLKSQENTKEYKSPLTENKFDTSKYDNLSSENKFVPQKSEISPVNGSPTRESNYSARKYADNASSAEPTIEERYQKYKNSIPTNTYKPDSVYDVSNYKFTSLNKPEFDIPKNDINSPPISSATKVESPTKENYNVNVFEKEPEPVSTTRRSSIFDKQFAEQSSPAKQIQGSTPASPKKQPYISNPPSPVRQFPESSSSPPIPMSRKNSVQYSVRKGSIQNSSIVEEPNNFPKTDKGRRYSKDQTPYLSEVGSKGANSNQYTDKRLSYAGSIKESIEEQKEEKVKNETYDDYPQYKESEKLSQPREYSEDYPTKKSYAEESYQNKNSDYNKPQQFQQYQSFDNTNPQYISPDTDNARYPEKSSNNEPSHQPNYNRYPDTNAPNYNERYYNEQTPQYDPSTGTTYKPYTEEYPYPEKAKEYAQDRYNYPTNYDTAIPENEPPYVESRSQYPDPTYSTEKRPSNESYYPESRPIDYEKYQDEDYNTDYYRNARNTENRSSNYQNEPYPNTRYREMPPDENYNDDYRYQSQPNYRDDPRSTYQEGYTGGDTSQYPSYDENRKSLENYSLNSTTEREPSDQNYPPSKQNSYDNPDYPSENYVEPTDEKTVEPVPAKITESIKPIVTDSKVVKDRKKSLAVEQSRESESSAPEPSPKETTLSRRTSRAALTLAEQRKAASEKAQLADKNKALKSKPAESKFKRTASMMKPKPAVKKT